jgi:hypothetical protein
MPLSRKPAPFDHPEWVFELKYDGFRSLAILQNGRCQLISRNGHSFSKRPRWAVLTGMVFGHVSIKKSSGQIRRYEDKSQGALISSV